MISRILSLSRRGPAALAVLTFALTAFALAWNPARGPSPSARALSNLFPKTERAKNPCTLQLQADDHKVVGWMSGTRDFSGTQIRVKIAGKLTDTLSFSKDNTFTWPYQVTKPTSVEFEVQTPSKEPLSHKAQILLHPLPAAPEPCVFFVVDRTAYRPNQQLQFAAFLRKQNRSGDFTPVSHQPVEVELTSQRKQTKAAKLKLTSDERGRIVGSYRFSDADALDNYTLTIPGYKGTATILLGEYRKSKVKLKIGGKLEGEKMKLSFEGLDFLDKPVPVTKVSFAAQVVRRGKDKGFTLKAEDFVYHQPRLFPLDELESLTEEELLFREAEGISAQTFGGMGNVPLSQFSAELQPQGSKPSEYLLDLKKEWLTGDCAVIVQGVITDANGREQRASTTIPLDPNGKQTDQPLTLELAKQRFFTSETIQVKAKGIKNATLAVMKLSFQTPSVALTGIGLHAAPYGRQHSARYRYRAIDPSLIPASETVRRSLVTAVPFQEEVAKVKLTAPGTYKLVAVVPREDGSSVQTETTVLVTRLDDTNPLLLKLDKQEYAVGERLTGIVHSRFADARALLTLRDSTGIRLVKPVTFHQGLGQLDELLPEGLRYGCTVDISYPEEEDRIATAHAFLRVVPKDRMLTVNIRTPEEVSPGSTVELHLDVNRKEPVDLVVSVYDQSLLGIAADRSTDIRSFFLADERAEGRFNQMMLQRRLGNLRLKTLFLRAEQTLKEADTHPLTPVEKQALNDLLARRKSRYVYAMDIATLLRLAGFEVYFAPYSWGHHWYRHFQATEEERLLDLLLAEHSGWTLTPRFVGSTLLLQETHPSYAQAGYTWHPVFGWDFGSPGGYYGFGSVRGYHQNLWSRNTLHLGAGMGFGGYAGRGFGRGDASSTWIASGNSAFSFMPEGQAVLSHLPLAGVGTPLLDADGDQSHIAIRRDFSDSAFWNATVRTDEFGKARVSFKLPDSLTNWQVVATAVSSNMHVGSTKASFRTFKPIMVWPMLPRTFTEGDRVEVFASVHNRTEEPQMIKVRLKVENGKILSPEEKTIKVGPKENIPVYWTFTPGQAGFTQLLMSADAPAGSDASLKRLPVVRAAAEQLVTASGTVKHQATIEIPEGFDPLSSRLEVTFAPSLAADMADTLNFLVEYPYGCVEQTMSRFLPAIKVAQILRQFKVEHKELEKKLPNCVSGGIKRLLELQGHDGGWGWHGNGLTHEMMTPYALYGLLQAEKAGYQIPNEQAIVRGLDRLEQFITNMGESQIADRIYCLYVFSHRKDLRPDWWTWIAQRAQAKALSDYALGLAVEMAVARGKTDLAKDLIARLRERAQKVEGHVYWQTAGFSRWGEDRFEITAQALRALVAYDKEDPLIDGILSFFTATKRGDRWNSTKDTAMILYALSDYLAKTEYNPQARKTLDVAVNGGKFETITFEDQLTRKLLLPGDRLRAGKNSLTFRTDMTGVLYRAVFRYWKTGRTIEPMDKGIKVVRSFHLLNDKGQIVRPLKSGDSIPRGSYVLSRVEATHRLPTNMNYVLVENPRPSTGETVPVEDPRFVSQQSNCTAYALREDREAMTCFHHETTPQTLQDNCVFLAELSGEFVVPPAKVELMYHTETRGHSGSFVLNVTEDVRKAKK